MKHKNLLFGAALAAVFVPFVSGATPSATIVKATSSSEKAGSVFAPKVFSSVTNAFSAGVWLKNPQAKWYTHYLYGDTWSLGFANNETFRFVLTQVSAADGSEQSVSVKPASGSPAYNKRWTWGSDNTWHFYFVTFSYDKDDAAKCFQRLYVDGALVAEAATMYGPLKKPTAYFGSGSSIDSSGRIEWSFYQGSFADLMFFDRALSTAEVAAMYATPKRLTGKESGLLVYYPLANFRTYCRNGAVGGPAVNALFKTQNSGTWTFAEDATLPMTDFQRCVASPQWVAEHHYVQSANATFRTWDDPATNIQEAADAAMTAEPVRVMPGSYTLAAEIAVSNRDSFVTSYDPSTGLPDRVHTILDCASACRGFKIGTGATDDNIEVHGFTVRNGRADEGGGVFLKGGASSQANLRWRCRLANCVITNCTGTSNGGGVSIDAGLVTNCLVTKCSSPLGGGICNRRAVQYSDARAYEYNLGAVNDCDIVGNSSSGYGGGYGNSVNFKWYTMLVRNSRFRDNTAKDSGGNIELAAGSWVEGCTFSGGCSAQYGDCICTGTANGNPPTITNCYFVGGTKSGSGYGFIHPSGRTLIVDCVVTNNKYNSSFVFNEGGGRVVIRQCLFADNDQSTVVTGFNSVSTFIENCTVAMTGAMKYGSNNTSKEIFSNCILCGTVTSSSAHQTIVSNCTVKALGGTPHASNANVYVGRKPGFRDAAHGDYTLRPTAFARDRGEKLGWMTATTDLAKNPRLVDRRGNANTAQALPDLGCYEQQDPVPATGAVFLK